MKNQIKNFLYFCFVVVAGNKVDDVRTVLQHYNQFDDPMAKFRENQAAVMVNIRLLCLTPQ